jgi:hypothetical protein
MQVRNLFEIKVDMTNKQDEIIQIINLYLTQIQNQDAKREFLLFMKTKIEQVLPMFETEE